jgi:phosphoserine phosphatase RsbU/P
MRLPYPTGRPATLVDDHAASGRSLPLPRLPTLAPYRGGGGDGERLLSAAPTPCVRVAVPRRLWLPYDVREYVVTDRLDLDTFERELDAFGRRIEALNPVRAGDAVSEELVAALAELDAAHEELRVAQEELLARHAYLADRDGVDRERKLMRAVFTDLPVPVFLLERDGVVRRTNRAACALVGVAAAYPTGKPFAVFLDLPARAAFRAKLAAAVRGGSARSCPVRLLAQGRSREVLLRLAPVTLPGEPDGLIAAVALPVGEQMPPAPPCPSRAEPVEATRRGDVLAAMTRLLLDDESFSEPGTLRRAAALLAGEFAEWVLVDVVADGRPGPDVLARQLVVGPDEVLAEAVRGLPPGPGELPDRVVATRRPVLEAHLDRPGELGRFPGAGGPVATALGASSAVGVPLLLTDRPAGAPAAAERVLGVVTLVRTGARPAFDLRDLGLLQQLCEHLALALRADRSFRRRSEVADALQTSLLPRRLPEPPGLRLAAAYQPATPSPIDGGPAVGGDFYDAVRSEGGWALVLGDVSGKGEDAAALTATVRHGVRVLAHRERRTGAVLAAVNNFLRAQGTSERFVTVALAHLERRPDGWRALVSGAGHPPPLVLAGDGRLREVRTGGRPLGLFADARPGQAEVELRPGDTLLLYSDGITEARGAGRRVLGEDGLAEAVTRAAGAMPEELVGRIRDTVVRFGDGRLRDDVSLLAARAV